MDLKGFIADKNEKPLDNICTDGGMCAIFRKIACIGDSLSSGEFESFMNGTTNWHDMFEYSWGQYIARMCGSKVYNFSRGGMTARAYCEEFAEINDFWNKELACQCYIMALGVNDISEAIRNECEFGSIDDVDFSDWKNNKKTFCGYYAKIIQRYKEIQPKAKVFLLTFPKSGTPDAERDPLRKRHYEFVYELSKRIPDTYIIDLNKYAPVYDDEFRRNFYLAGHLNPQGYILTAKMVASYIDYIVRNNPEDFAQVGFIGKPWHNENFKW